MNVLVKVQPPPDAAKIAHSVMAYDLATEELDLELPIPLFLDTLALKIARVPPDDKYGALSYRLEAKAVDTFRFLLGMDVDMAKREYFLESTVGHATNFGPRKLEAVELLTQVTPRPRYARTEKPRISERELVVPTLRLLADSNMGWMATSDTISQLTELFVPSGQDAKILRGATRYILLAEGPKHDLAPGPTVELSQSGVGTLRTAWPADFRCWPFDSSGAAVLNLG